jgi:hypothetical protein
VLQLECRSRHIEEDVSTLMTVCFSEMQQEQPQFYSSLASHLSAEDQNLLQTIMVKADEIQAKVAQQLLLAQQQAQAPGGAPTS